jgi:hypothetical protein
LVGRRGYHFADRRQGGFLSRREPEVVCKFFYEGFFTAASGEPR